MKICFISGALPDVSCGIGDYSDALASALARRSHDVVVLTTDRPELRAPSNYRVAALGTDWSAADTGRIATAVRREHPDVVHLQFPGVGYGRGLGATFTPWAMRLRGHRPLLVATFHEFHLFRPRIRARLALAASACDLLISPDPTVLASLQRHLRWRPGLVTEMIPLAANVLPAAEAEPPRRPAGQDELVIGYWGFLRPDKGVHLLLEAVAQIRQAQPARLVLAGDPGPDVDYTASLEKRAEELGLSAAIRATGKLPPAALSAELQSFDVCVLPFRDGLSQNRTTYAAAVAHGLYVVTTGLHNIGFDPETNTTFVPPNDRDALVSAILEAPSHPRQLRSGGYEGSWDEIADLHVAAYWKRGVGD
jgi:glycosyltransferase involved in cell wall biosynthesis